MNDGLAAYWEPPVYQELGLTGVHDVSEGVTGVAAAACPVLTGERR